VSLKTILVPLSGGESDRPALGSALGLAKRFEGHVDAVFLRPDPQDLVPMVGEAMTAVWMEQFIESAEREMGERLEAASALFAGMLKDAGVAEDAEPPGPGGASASLREIRGRPDRIAAEGRLNDALLFSPSARQPDDPGHVALETSLMEAGRPLILAADPAPGAIGSTIAIAWNGNTQSARAVSAASPLIARADAVHVLTVETGATSGDAGEGLAGYLRWHGKKPEVHRMSEGAEGVGATLSGRAKIGGFSHSRLREMILGGVTRHVISSAELPVLIAH